MARYLADRMLGGIAVLAVVAAISFFLVNLIPGDPVDVYIGDASVSEATRHQIEVNLGLDRPLSERFTDWFSGLLRGDMGTSLFNNESVSAELANRLVPTLHLVTFAFVLGIAWGIPAGVITATRQRSVSGIVVRVVSFVGLATPAFLLGTLFVMLTSIYLPRWSVVGYTRLSENILASFASILLPAIALSVALGSTLSRYVRSSLVDVLELDYIRTARAKGVGRRALLLQHGLRNALVPVATVASVQFAALMGATAVIETVFAIPGIGRLFVEAIMHRDYPLIQGCLLLLGAVFVVTNLAVDLTYPLIDPRIGAGARAS